MRRFTLILSCLLSVVPLWAQDLESALEQVSSLVTEHRFSEVIDILAPFADIEDPEARYAVVAETGRAYFHLGDYRSANAAFKEAVSLRPRRAETALYLMATSYLVGDRDLAHSIFREILSSGATDLYLAITLPGERNFLSDPVVTQLLGEFTVPLNANIDRGSVLEVELGQPRTEVETRLGAESGADGTALTARAGPYLTWVFGYDESDSLAQIMLYNEHLVRYTPYRLDLGSSVDWRATPETATANFGAPASTTRDGEDIVVMVWNRGGVRMTLEFAPPRQPIPSGLSSDRPCLRVVRLERLPPQPGDQ